jgi:hypothetical protein
MRRSLLDCGRSILAGSALVAIFLSPAQAGDPAPKASGAGAAAKAAASGNTSGRSGPTQGKILYTVPEDGMVAEDVPASSRLVRDLIGKHPSEDVIICLAGCRSLHNRVVYAQPAEPVAAKPAAKVSEGGSEPPVKPAIANSVEDKPKMSPATAVKPAAAPEMPKAETAKSEPAKAEPAKADAAAPAPAIVPAQAAQPGKSVEGNDTNKPQLLPTMAPETTQDGAATADTSAPAAAPDAGTSPEPKADAAPGEGQ